MRHSRIQTICLFLFTILLVGGMARTAAAQGSTSYIDEHNRFILNGEPFFPIGLYVAQCSTEADHSFQLNQIEDSPFDTLMNYSINSCDGIDATPEQINDYLDQLQIPQRQRNLNLIFSLVRCDPGFEGRPLDVNTIAEKVDTFKDHPAIISWYNNDEVDPQYLGELGAAYDKITELDQNHPVWSVHWNTDWLLPEARTTDILGIDSYPIDNNPITVVSLVADVAAQVGAETDKPFWLVPQIFSWEDGRGDPAGRDLTGRPPTREEMLAMTYLAINHGAKGLIYYSYFNILDDPDYDTRWPEIKEVASKIDQLRTVFLSTYQTDDNDIVCDNDNCNDNIDFKLMREGNTYYLFAVNKKAPSKIIMDNPDAAYVGNWPTVQGDPQATPPTYPYGDNFQENTTPDNGDTATWTPDITQAGDYRVYARWTADTTNGATDAPYTINYDGGSKQVTVDQQVNGDRWILLGTYRFTAGTSGSVVLTDKADGVVIADAIMWLLKEGDVTSASFQIDLAEKPAELYTRFEDGRRLPVTNGKFTDGFNPYEVHVYYWEEPESDGGGGGNGGLCFIATAAFGSYVDPHVQVIRDFRDEYLLTNMPGRWFVGMYNTYGPFWADLLNAHPSCKPFVRLALMPVVGMSYFALKTSLATKLLTGFLLMGLVVICVLRIHSRSSENNK